MVLSAVSVDLFRLQDQTVLFVEGSRLLSGLVGGVSAGVGVEVLTVGSRLERPAPRLVFEALLTAPAGGQWWGNVGLADDIRGAVLSGLGKHVRPRCADDIVVGMSPERDRPQVMRLRAEVIWVMDGGDRLPAGGEVEVKQVGGYPDTPEWAEAAKRLGRT